MSEYEKQVLLVNKIGSQWDAAVLKSLVALALHKFLPDVKILWDAMLGVTNKPPRFAMQLHPRGT